MDTSRYRQLLAEYNEYVRLSDAKSARVTDRWLCSLDQLHSSSNTRHALLEHTGRVSRSLSAITILCKEAASQKNLAGAEEVLESTAVNLRAEIAVLQKEAQEAIAVLSDRGMESIVGEMMSSIEFVMDYVQLHFNNSTLTSFTYPLVHVDGKNLGQTDAGYRDAICALIGRYVARTETRPEEALKIVFAEGNEIEVSLREADSVGPEFAYFTSSTGSCWVW